MRELKLEPGHGRETVVNLSVNHPNGARDLQLVQVLVNHELNGAHGCYVSYDVSDNRLWLIGDSGTGSSGWGHPGDRLTLSNSQCGIALEHTQSALENETLSLKIHIVGTASFTGVQHVYVSGQDVTGFRIEWADNGKWLVQ